MPETQLELLGLTALGFAPEEPLEEFLGVKVLVDYLPDAQVEPALTEVDLLSRARGRLEAIRGCLGSSAVAPRRWR